jgi:hypothetical protein
MDFIIHSKQTYLFDLYYDDNCSVLFSLGKQALNSMEERRLFAIKIVCAHFARILGEGKISDV